MSKSKVYIPTDEEFAKIVAEASTYSDCLRALGLGTRGGSSTDILKKRIKELGLSVDTNIRQVNKVARTGKTIDHRLAFQPAFGGEVQQGKDYLIVDDTLAAGGTIASLKGYIENRGGKVVGGVPFGQK